MRLLPYEVPDGPLRCGSSNSTLQVSTTLRIINRVGVTLARSTAEGVVEEGNEEMLGLTQRLTLHRTEVLYALHQSREVLLEGKRRQRNQPSLQCACVNHALSGSCSNRRLAIAYSVCFPE